MTSSFRWYSVKKAGKPLDARAFLKSILKAGETRDCWFSQSGAGSSIKFFRRVEILVPEIDARGAEATRAVESITSVEFELVELAGKTLLRVANPGRNMQALMSNVERVVGSGFSARLLTFGESQPNSILSKADIKRIVGVKLVNIAVTNDCIGRMELASKGGIDVKKLPLLRGLKYKTDYMKYEIVIAGERGAFSFSSSGLVKVSGALSSLIVQELQRDLARIS
jgi:hypothetical protein